MTPPIESVDDLAAQKKILYGIVKGGSTEAFFKVSLIFFCEIIYQDKRLTIQLSLCKIQDRKFSI